MELVEVGDGSAERGLGGRRRGARGGGLGGRWLKRQRRGGEAVADGGGGRGAGVGGRRRRQRRGVALPGRRRTDGRGAARPGRRIQRREGERCSTRAWSRDGGCAGDDGAGDGGAGESRVESAHDQWGFEFEKLLSVYCSIEGDALALANKVCGSPAVSLTTGE